MNNRFKCIAIDDNPIALEIIKGYVEKIPTLNLVKTFTNPIDGMIYLQQNEINLLFIDIEMPSIKGNDLLKTLPKIPPTIFTTGHIETAKIGFDLGISDFLLKPFSFERFLKAVNRSLSDDYASLLKPKFDDGHLFLKIGKLIQKFKYSDIQYIEAYGVYTKVYTAQKWHLVSESITNLAEKLPTTNFVRVHKSYIISLSQITGFDNKNIWIHEIKIPIGSTYQKTLELSFVSMPVGV